MRNFEGFSHSLEGLSRLHGDVLVLSGYNKYVRWLICPCQRREDESKGRQIEALQWDCGPSAQ